MTSAVPIKRYWDSCNWISLIAEDEQRRADTCQRILSDAEAGKCVIVTSTLTLAEVVKVKGQPLLSEEQERIIITFFEHEYIAIHDVTRRVAEYARNLARNHGLKPPDSIHLATAILAGTDVFETWNTNDFASLQGNVPIRIAEPTWIGTLPMSLD